MQRAKRGKDLQHEGRRKPLVTGHNQNDLLCTNRDGDERWHGNKPEAL